MEMSRAGYTTLVVRQSLRGIYVRWHNPDQPHTNQKGIVENHTIYTSRFRAKIIWDRVRNKWFITDGHTRHDENIRSYRPSTNGTLVNGVETGQKDVELHIGDIITLNDTILEVVVKN